MVLVRFELKLKLTVFIVTYKYSPVFARGLTLDIAFFPSLLEHRERLIRFESDTLNCLYLYSYFHLGALSFSGDNGFIVVFSCLLASLEMVLVGLVGSGAFKREAALCPACMWLLYFIPVPKYSVAV